MLKILTLNVTKKNSSILHNLLKKTVPDVKFYFETEVNTCLDITSTEELDVIFLDLDIPNENVFRNCKSLKKENHTQNIPVVFLANAEIEKNVSAQALEAGCDAILTKPFNEYELLILIKAMQKIKRDNSKQNAKNEIELKRDRADNILEGTNAGTWDWNILNGEMIINRRWAEMVGYSINELKPVSIEAWKEKVHPWDLRIAENKIKLHLNNKLKYYYAEFRQRHKNGNWVWINSRGKVVEWTIDGKPARMAGTHIDITHKKSIERELIKAKKKAEENDHLKSAFLSNMSHEIRTPMNGILGFIDLLKNPDLTINEQSRYIDIVKKSGDRLLNTINDIIEISKIEAGETPLHIAETDINELIQHFYVFFKPEAESKGLKLILSPNESTQPVIAKTDCNKLESIVINLIKNAIKFTTSGTVEFGYEIWNSKLFFFVKDTGKGIKGDKIKAVFERFVQANLKFNRGHEGSGLGLSIAKYYTQMLGGEIWVKSEPNVGSTFQFTINYHPVVVEKLTLNEETHLSSNENICSNRQILVAEDEEVNFLLIEQILKDMNLEFFHAENGLKAIEICKANPNISLVLMDIKMPIMDGFAAAKQIKKFSPDLPIIGQSAYVLEHEIKKFNRIFDDYITKPINKDEMKQKVKKYIIKSRLEVKI